MSALLLDEQLLCYQPKLVRRLGLAEAAIVQQLHYWAQRATNSHDGHVWVYKTYADWSAEIGISSKAIRGACDRLRKDGVLVAIQSPLDPRDRTLWWRIDHDVLDADEPGAPSAPEGRPDDAGGSSRAGDRGSTETTPEITSRENARARPPENFPDELRPHAKEAMRILVAVAEQHGAAKVWPLAVGRVVMAHPRHRLVGQAHALAAWSVGSRPIRDVVSTYRGFLERDGEQAAVERLAEDGTPTAGAQPHPAGVTPTRRDKNAERQARYERRKAAWESREDHTA